MEAPAPYNGCPDYHAAIELIGRRWNGVLLVALLSGAARFSELKQRIPGVTDAMLSQRLRELEQAGLVSREVSRGRPVEVWYQLTAIGERLSPVLESVAAWSTEWAASRSG